MDIDPMRAIYISSLFVFIYSSWTILYLNDSITQVKMYVLF